MKWSGSKGGPGLEGKVTFFRGYVCSEAGESPETGRRFQSPSGMRHIKIEENAGLFGAGDFQQAQINNIELKYC